jgi:hypothetical protein
MQIDQEPHFSERRYPRAYQELPLLFRVLQPEKEKEWVSTKIKILGGGGLSLISPVSMPVGTVLHGKLSYYAHVIEFSAEIVWMEPFFIGEATRTRYGLTFTQISQDSLLTIHDIINKSQHRSIQLV